jgi:PAS domain S-box-containing protein
LQDLQTQVDDHLPGFVEPTWRWINLIGLGAAVGVAYFLAARLSLMLLTKPDGVAVFWPAAGVAAGVLLALGPSARLPAAAGAMAATIVANLLGDRTIWSAIVFALCNAGEALLVAALIEFYFGSSFNLGKLRYVAGFLAATIVGTAVSGIGGTAGYVWFHNSTAPILTIWHHWFTSDALGIVTVAPLLIGLGSAMRDPPPRREVIEGAAALITLSLISGLIIFLPREPWATVVAIVLLFPLLLWLAARCRPVFSAAAAFIIALTIVWTTTFAIGIFGDTGFPSAERVLVAQAGILAASLCAFVLAALFAERRQHEVALRESEARTPELKLLYETAPIGLAFLTPDCRYLQINRHLTEICGISVADHIGRSVRDTVPQVADQVEKIVQAILRTGESITGIEVNGQRPDGGNSERVWVTNWYPLKTGEGSILGVNVVAEEITERKQAQAALVASETRFRELADNMSQFAWTADAQGSIYWYNKRWHDYAGTTLEEMQGWGWQKVHHPEHVDRVVDRIRQCFAAGSPWEDTFPLRGKDGTYRWFLSRALPIRNEAGDLVRWFGTNTDVNEQIEAEKALRILNETLEHRVETEAQERARIWNVSEDLLVVADMEGRSIAVNPAWQTTLGWSEGELLNKTFEWLIHPDDLAKTRAQQARVAGGLSVLHFENRLQNKTGSYHWLSWKAVAEKGKIYGVARDITDLKSAADQLRISRRELARVSRHTTMGAMTASIAHEVNQPLTALVTNANAGLRWLDRPEPDVNEVRALLKRIVDDGHRASAVIAGIRSMFRKDGDEGKPLSVNDLIGEVLAVVRGELESHQVSLQTELRDDLPLVLAEQTQLQQVILNLIMNAVEAMSSIADRDRVMIVKSEMGGSDHALIIVEDSGAGIDPSHMSRIFEPFFTTKTHGMGMGLSICRSIIELHGGQLQASPRNPYGSIFCARLPIIASANIRDGKRTNKIGLHELATSHRRGQKAPSARPKVSKGNYST